MHETPNNTLYTASGIAVLVNFGATEITAETAIATLPIATRERVRGCDAPIVEEAMIIGIEVARGDFPRRCLRVRRSLFKDAKSPCLLNTDNWC